MEPNNLEINNFNNNKSNLYTIYNEFNKNTTQLEKKRDRLINSPKHSNSEYNIEKENHYNQPFKKNNNRNLFSLDKNSTQTNDNNQKYNLEESYKNIQNKSCIRNKLIGKFDFYFLTNKFQNTKTNIETSPKLNCSPLVIENLNSISYKKILPKQSIKTNEQIKIKKISYISKNRNVFKEIEKHKKLKIRNFSSNLHKRNINGKIMCKKFKECPQKFFGEKLCNLLLQSMDLIPQSKNKLKNTYKSLNDRKKEDKQAYDNLIKYFEKNKFNDDSECRDNYDKDYYGFSNIETIKKIDKILHDIDLINNKTL